MLSKAANCRSWIVIAKGRRPDGQPMCGVWPKASLICGTHVTRVRIDGGSIKLHQPGSLWYSGIGTGTFVHFWRGRGGG